MALRWARTMLCYWNFLQSDVGHACFEDPEQASWAGQDPENVTVLGEPLHLRRETSLKQSWPPLGEESLCVWSLLKLVTPRKGRLWAWTITRAGRLWSDLCLLSLCIPEYWESPDKPGLSRQKDRPKSKWSILESPCSHIFHNINTHDKQNKWRSWGENLVIKVFGST